MRPHYPSSPLSYSSTPLNYPSNQARLRTQKIDPRSAAAQRQSGLNQAEASDLMATHGYTHLGDVQADPNSIWVWQADAMKNGRKVHLGIDTRQPGRYDRRPKPTLHNTRGGIWCGTDGCRVAAVCSDELHSQVRRLCQATRDSAAPFTIGCRRSGRRRNGRRGWASARPTLTSCGG